VVSGGGSCVGQFALEIALFVGNALSKP